MKRFFFSLQTVQDLRNNKREEAERELAQAEAQVLNAKTALEKTLTERVVAIDAYVAALAASPINIQDIMLRTSHLALLSQREEQQRVLLASTEELRDAKRHLALAAMQQAETLSALRERHHSRHTAMVARAEQTALDEIAMLNFVRRNNR
jgi:flagellar export protein FliJ